MLAPRPPGPRPRDPWATRFEPARNRAPRKDDPPVTFPTSRPKPRVREPDPHQAAAGRAGHRPGLGGPVGGRGRHEPQAAGAGPGREAENRLAKALWELGSLGEAREHYRPRWPWTPPTASPSATSIAQGAAQRCRGEDRPGDGGQQGARQHLRGGDRKTGFAFLTDLATRRNWRRSTRATTSSSRRRVAA